MTSPLPAYHGHLHIGKATPPRREPLDARERNVARAILAAVRAAAAQTDQAALIRALESGDASGAVAALGWAAAEAALSSALPKQYRITHELAREAGAKQVRRALRKAAAPAVGYGFDYTNPDSVEWARLRSATLIREWGASSQAALRALIVQAFEDGIPPAKLGRMIRASGIGLTERQAVAVARRRAQLVRDGVAEGRVDSLVDRYAAHLLKVRGETIARTEIIAAHTAGAQASWAEAVDEGLLNPETARQVWITDGDERSCELCLALDGQEAALGEPFEEGVYGPPRHPACRCNVSVKP